jgi:hypothetical protein
MSCAKSSYGEEYANYIDSINNRRFNNSRSNNLMSNNSLPNNFFNSNCRKGFLPSFTPKLYSLSSTSSENNTYKMVFVNGSNFLPNGTTFIKFGNFGYLPTTYYSSFNLSFVVPLNAIRGHYNVQVVNLYNSNFSTPVNQTYSGNLNYSNSITYTIT